MEQFKYLFYYSCYKQFGSEKPIDLESAIIYVDKVFRARIYKGLNVYDCLEKSSLFNKRDSDYYCCSKESLSEGDRIILNFLALMLKDLPSCFRKEDLANELKKMDDDLYSNEKLNECIKKERYACKCSSLVINSALSALQKAIL